MKEAPVAGYRIMRCAWGQGDHEHLEAVELAGDGTKGRSTSVEGVLRMMRNHDTFYTVGRPRQTREVVQEDCSCGEPSIRSAGDVHSNADIKMLEEYEEPTG